MNNVRNMEEAWPLSASLAKPDEANAHANSIQQWFAIVAKSIQCGASSDDPEYEEKIFLYPYKRAPKEFMNALCWTRGNIASLTYLVSGSANETFRYGRGEGQVESREENRTTIPSRPEKH